MNGGGESHERVMKAVTEPGAPTAPSVGDWAPSELDKQVGGLDKDRTDIVKARLIGLDESTQTSNVMHGVDEAERRFHLAGAIEPPYNPTTLAALIEHSNALRQNVDAYATNIDGFGHRFEPIIDLDAADADQKIAQAISIEREAMKADPGQPPSVVNLPALPTAEEIALRKTQLVDEMRVEKAMLEHFFEFCTEDSSFVSLRRKLRQDLEVLGNAYVEVLRNGAGEPAGFVYVPGFTMRLLPLDRVLTDVIVQQRVSSIALKPVKRKKQLRKLVQVFEAFTVYFKEFGDPRIISKRTGRVFETEAELIDADKDDSPATEVLHFKVHSSRTAYGVPRWIGNLLSVLGSRQAEEVNYLYFENKSIPPMAILVNGGRISDGTEKRIEDYIGSEIKGKKNFHKILIIEAVGDGGSTLENPGKTRIEFKQLTDAQNKDALFQNYDERNIDKVGMSFRLPRMLRGDIRDFNRASAEAALEFAEQQVFQPEREEFDFIINRRILPAIGVRYWRFASNSPTVNDPKELATMVKDLVLANVIVPAEAREICEDIFNKEFPAIDAAWTKQPVPLTLAGISPTDATSTPWSGEDDPLIPHTPYSEQAEQKAGEPPRITATALGHVVTVNEAREAYGLSPKTLADGSPDPAGNITIGEHLERVKQQHLQQYGPGARAKDIGGGDMGDSIAGAPMPQIADGGTLTIHDLQTQGGLLGLHQGQRRFRRLPPRSASSNTPAGAAKQLLAIRDALLDAEATTAAHEFYREKRAELEGRIPREAIAAAVPVETVADAADKK